MAKLTEREQIEKLQAEIASLTSALTKAEARADANTEAALRAKYIGSDNEEIPTGKTTKITVLKSFKVVGYTNEGIPMKEPIWEEQEVDTFLYKIDMPGVGGTQIMLNGVPLYHGETYTFDIHTLRTVKEMVYRLRAHEAAVFGSNENAYRKPLHATFSGKTGGRIH